MVENEKINTENTNELIKNLTLKLFHVGSNPINYKILTLLPNDIKTLMIILDLTKVPINNRVNALLKASLVNREIGTGRVHITSLGCLFLEIFDIVEKDVKKDFVHLFKMNLD